MSCRFQSPLNPNSLQKYVRNAARLRRSPLSSAAPESLDALAASGPSAHLLAPAPPDMALEHRELLSIVLSSTLQAISWNPRITVDELIKEVALPDVPEACRKEAIRAALELLVAEGSVAFTEDNRLLAAA